MKILAMNDLVQQLRIRLEPVERADELIDVIEGQRPEARKSAVLLALFEQDSVPFLAFIRRASSLRAHSGEIAFPGGKVEPTDLSPVMTALREAHEEIGLEASRVEVLGILPPVFTVVSNYLITPIVSYIPDGLGTLHLQTSEVTELFLLPLHTLADPVIAHTEVWNRGNVTRTVYFYDHEACRIWGATGRILSMLLSLLYDKNE